MDEMLTAKIAVHAMSDGKNPSELKTASTQPSQIEPAPPETGGVASSASQGTRTVIIPWPWARSQSVSELSDTKI